MSYATYNVKEIKITSEKNVTIDFVVNEANNIWREVSALPPVTQNNMDIIQQSHPEFCKAYPIVVRYMCQMQQYDTKAFRKWLMKIRERPWKTENEYLDAQADYVSMLYRAKNPRAPGREINHVRDNIRTILRDEHTIFKYYAEKSDKEINSKELALREKNKDELHEFVKLAGTRGMAPAGTVRVETDVATGIYSVLADNIIMPGAVPTYHTEITSADLLL